MKTLPGLASILIFLGALTACGSPRAASTVVTAVPVPTATQAEPSATASRIVTPVPTATKQAAVASPFTMSGRVIGRPEVRREPISYEDNVVAEVKLNESVTLIGRLENSTWYVVRTTDGTVGWMNADMIATEHALASQLPIEPPTALAIAPTAGPARNGLSPEVRRYLEVSGEATGKYSDALGRLGKQMGQVGDNPSLLQDQEWILATAAIAVQLDAAAEQLGSISPVPAELEAVDEYQKRIARETPLLTRDLSQGVDRLDGTLFVSVADRLNLITGWIRDAQAELGELQP